MPWQTPTPRDTIRSQAAVIHRKRTAICRESIQGKSPPMGSQTIYLVDGLHNSLTLHTGYHLNTSVHARELHKHTHSPHDVTDHMI